MDSDKKRKRGLLLSLDEAFKALKRCVECKDVEGFKQTLFSSHCVEGFERRTVDDVLASLVHKIDEENWDNSSGDTLFTALARTGDLPMLTVVLDYLRSTHRLSTIDTAQGDGMTALMTAVCNCHAEVVKLLLSEGANVDKASADEHGWTPLIFACWLKHEDIVKILLDAGADVNKATSCASGEEWDGSTPLFIATKKGNTKIVKLLLGAGADIDKARADGETPPSAAIEKGNDEILTLLLEEGADVEKADNKGETLLHAACYYGRTEIVTLLLNRVADVDKTNTAFLESPLHIACQEGYDGIAKLLLGRGAYVDRPDKYGKRPIYIACFRGRERCLATLLEHRADFGLFKRRRPIAAALRGGFAECVKILREWPALRNLRNQESVKLCCSRLKRQGTYETLQAIPLNELSSDMFVYKVLDEMISRGMYCLAENVVSCVGIGKTPPEEEGEEDYDVEDLTDDDEEEEWDCEEEEGEE